MKNLREEIRLLANELSMIIDIIILDLRVLRGIILVD